MFGFNQHQTHPREKNTMPMNGDGDGQFWLDLIVGFIIILVVYGICAVAGLQ